MNEENTVIPSREEHYLQVPPTQVNVRIYTVHTSGPALAKTSADLNDCFTIRGLKAVDVGSGSFISIPGYRTGSGYQDVCFPGKREFRQQPRQAVLDAYEQAPYQLPQRQQEYQAESTQNSKNV